MRIFLLLLFLPFSLFAQVSDASILQKKAPGIFRAVFHTTKGNFTIEVPRSWSPHGADRLYQLIISGFFTDSYFYRVEPGFIVQFGIAAATAINRFWDPLKIPDDPMLLKNTQGTISFARIGKNSRSTQLFINLADNKKLDVMSRNGLVGYTPVARIVSGFSVVQQLYAGYQKAPQLLQDSLYKYGNSYFIKRFPRLDKIQKAEILP
ncbi:MAG TPA: peptidylprolyl isomerase [Sediminibacterium sp.]|nr:peptidylprolyl isomerase [Sediminibacterium sp.]